MEVLDWLPKAFPGAPWVGPTIAIIVLLALAVAMLKLLFELGKLLGRGWRSLGRFVDVVETFSEMPEQMGRLDAFATENAPMLRQLAEQVLNDHGNVNLRDELTQAKVDSAAALTAISEVREIVVGLDKGVAGLYQDREATATTLDGLDKRLEDVEDTFQPHRDPGIDPTA